MPSTKLPTVYINQGNAVVMINESDYDPEIHGKLVEAPLPTAPVADLVAALEDMLLPAIEPELDDTPDGGEDDESGAGDVDEVPSYDLAALKAMSRDELVAAAESRDLAIPSRMRKPGIMHAILEDQK